MIVLSGDRREDPSLLLPHNMALLLVFGLFLLSLVVPGQQIDLRFSKVLDTSGNVLLRWGFDSSAEQIAFELQVKTTGWVGFGLSPGGGMTGADIIIGGVFPNRTTYFSDYHGIGDTTPVIDTVQNYQLLSLTENGTFTTMRFSRAFRTCDSNDMNITEGTYRVIAAFGTDDTISYHGKNDFTKSIYLLQELPSSGLSSPNNSMSYNMTMSNFTVMAQPTTYGCAFLHLPRVTEKHHIYKVEPLIQAGNERFIQHILLYACPNNTNISSAPGQCYTTNPLFLQCWQVLVTWAVGGGEFQFPDNVGLPFGSPGDPVYVRLEIRYNNPEMKNFTDNSGIRLYYTKNLRQYDAGILQTGSNFWNQFIPPHAQSFHVYGLCDTGYFNEVADMQVFAYMLHTNVAGRAVQVAHYRNDSQIGFLGRDLSLDYNLQEVRYLKNITTIKMGDIIQVECTYNTMDRTNLTLIGLDIMNEMCLDFLYYYPKNNTAQCLSSPDMTDTMEVLQLTDVQDIYSIVWNNTTINLMQQAIQGATQYISIRNEQISLSEIYTGYLYNITELANTTCNNATFSRLPATLVPNSNSATFSTPPATSNPDLNSNGSGSLQGSVVLLSLSLILLQAALRGSVWPPRASP